MRHGDKIKNLGRKKAHREALLSNLSCQLIEHKRIVTTLAKAKALRVYVEPLITKGRTNTTHQRRVVFSYLQDKEAVTELFSTIAEKIAGRPGGYTRIIKLGARHGDNAETAMIELVDFNEVYGKGKGEAKTAAKKTRRSGGAKKKQKLLMHLKLKKKLLNNLFNKYFIKTARNGQSFFV
jgi:large subunit ribosomal protein L17